MTNSVKCDICFTEDDLEYDVSAKTLEQYKKCPPDWVVALNGKIDIATKHETGNRTIQIEHICFDCLKDMIMERVKKQKELYDQELEELNMDGLDLKECMLKTGQLSTDPSNVDKV